MEFINPGNNHRFRIENTPKGAAVVERDFQGEFVQILWSFIEGEVPEHTLLELADKMGWEEV